MGSAFRTVASVSDSVLRIMAADLVDGRAAVSDTINRFAGELKNTYRQQVLSAGLGSRVANAWRSQTYPVGRKSYGAAALVWTKAPNIVDAFDRGVTIARHDGIWLAIPTENVPRRGRGGGHKVTPADVEAAFNQDLIFLKGKRPDTGVLVLRAIKSRSKRGWRAPTAKRKAQGRNVTLVVMFVLVKQVTLQKRLDVAGPAERIGALLPDAIVATWEAQAGHG